MNVLAYKLDSDCALKTLPAPLEVRGFFMSQLVKVSTSKQRDHLEQNVQRTRYNSRSFQSMEPYTEVQNFFKVTLLFFSFNFRTKDQTYQSYYHRSMHIRQVANFKGFPLPTWHGGQTLTANTVSGDGREWCQRSLSAPRLAAQICSDQRQGWTVFHNTPSHINMA